MEFGRLKNNPYVQALCVNFLALVASFIFGSGKFSSLDDFFMSSVLNGAYGGEYDIHLYFVNSIYGIFLKPLYMLFPAVGWYGVFEIFSVFFSFTTISYFVLKNGDRSYAFLLSLLLTVCASVYFYFYPGFTQCSSALSASGILLLVNGDREKKYSFLCLGACFLIWGYVMRKEMFLLGLPTFILVFVWSFIRTRKIWKWTIVAFVFVVGIVFALKVSDSKIYETDGYDYYAAYQPARAFFGDAVFYDGDALTDEMYETGLSGRDYGYLKSWYFYDKDVFSIDSLRNLQKVALRNTLEPNYAKMPLAMLHELSNNFSRPIMWFWLIISVLLVLFSKGWERFLPWFSLSIVGISYVYLLLVARVVSHVESGIWLLAIVLLISFLKEAKIDLKERRSFVIDVFIILALSSLVFFGVGLFFDNTGKKSHQVYGHSANWDEFFAYAEEHPMDVFILPYDRYKELAQAVGVPYKSVKPHSWQNIFPTGYWNVYLPAMEMEMRKRGVENLFKDLKNENVFVVNDEKKRSFVPFYKDHYHETIKADTVRFFGDMFLLKYRSAEVE